MWRGDCQRSVSSKLGEHHERCARQSGQQRRWGRRRRLRFELGRNFRSITGVPGRCCPGGIVLAQNQAAVNFWSEVGVGRCGKFYRDGRFLFALVLGMAVWGVAWFVAPRFFTRLPYRDFMLMASLILWQPVLEELLFRGVIQGQVARQIWGNTRYFGLSSANLLTSVLFALMHLVYHAPLWAIAVFAPSLVFGYFRDRYQSIWPGLLFSDRRNLIGTT
jgi:hypothetical protein